jgi:signal transduction histidine kinase
MTVSWYKSLYWRIGLGLIAFLALMLAAEGALFIWTTDRIAGSMPARSPRRLAVLVASDVGAAMAANPSLNLQEYITEQYGHVFQTFLVTMRDGRIVANHDDVDADVMEAARAFASRPFGEPRQFGERRFGFGGAFPRGEGSGNPRGEGPGGFRGEGSGNPRGDASGGFRGDGSGSPRGESPGGSREGGGGPRADGQGGPQGGPPLGDEGGRLRLFRGESAPIIVEGRPVGRVAVVPGGPAFTLILRELGPRMGLVAGGVLGVGTTLIALIVFGPTRRRLKEVQRATQELGAGDLSARAPEGGGDEVAALSQSFNRMADELGNRARALVASDNARRQLLADVSHELMTPLTAMRGYIETLAMPEVKLDPSTRARYIDIVTDETYRMERIIGDLLDLARLEGGGTSMRHEPVAIATLFDRVASRHERELAARGVTLVRQIGPGAERVTGDPDRLEQALQNLAANALRHTPQGGSIQLTAQRGEGGVRVGLRDTGPGIAPEHLPLIFDRFYKADASRKAAGNGSGLGLSIVKAIVERHGGTIAASNHPEGGAMFEIALPA